MENPPPRFSRRVENYIKYRPRYPQAMIDLLQRECHLITTAVIADIGSGTGLLTEVFLKNGYRVFGVEPDSEMRAAAEYLLQGYWHFTSISATAEATTLAGHSVDVVAAGQAFHWFDREQARRALEALFQTHQVDGTITIEQETRVCYGQISNT